MPCSSNTSGLKWPESSHCVHSAFGQQAHAMCDRKVRTEHVLQRTSMESFFVQMRKQDDSCGRGVPALNSVGLACVNLRVTTYGHPDDLHICHSSLHIILCSTLRRTAAKAWRGITCCGTAHASWRGDLGRCRTALNGRGHTCSDDCRLLCCLQPCNSASASPSPANLPAN